MLIILEGCYSYFKSHPFAKFRLRSTPMHLDPLFGTLDKEKLIDNIQTFWLAYCAFPPQAINSSWILVTIRIHQRYDMPLKFFHHIWPKINICLTNIYCIYENLLPFYFWVWNATPIIAALSCLIRVLVFLIQKNLNNKGRRPKKKGYFLGIFS